MLHGCRFLICVSLLLTTLPVHPQSPSSAPFPADVHVYGILKMDLSTKSSKVGDPVELDVVHAVSVFDGHKMQQLVPQHARLFGTVTMVRKAGKDQPGALAIQIVGARWKNGTGRLNGILGKSVLAAHSFSGFAQNAGPQRNRMQNGSGMLPFDGATVIPEQEFGSALSGKHDFFLVKVRFNLRS